MKKENFIEERRNFIKKAGMALGAGIALTSVTGMLNSCEHDESSIPKPPPVTTNIDINKYPALNTVGNSIKIVIPKKNNNAPMIFTRVDDNTISVIDSVCTHAGCEVNLPSNTSNEMLCPCHFVVFSKIDGTILKNPLGGSWSQNPLPVFKVVEFDKVNNILKVDI
jgi:Rieske Fe-S protein